MNYHNITYPDMNNGSGLRVVLWLSGCSHKCKDCQNPQTWDVNSGIQFDESAKEELFRELDKDYISGLTLTGGDPLFESNLDGVLDLVTEINKRYNMAQNIDYISASKHNILSKDTNETRLSSPKKSIWLYTGYTIYFADYCNKKVLSAKTDDYTLEAAIPTVLREKILEGCDVIVDGRYIDSQRDISLKWCGSSNQRVINIQETLNNGKIVLWTN